MRNEANKNIMDRSERNMRVLKHIILGDCIHLLFKSIILLSFPFIHFSLLYSY